MYNEDEYHDDDDDDEYDEYDDDLVPEQSFLPNLKQQSSVKVADFTEDYDGEHIF